MKVTLNQKDYESISVIVRKKLCELMPDNELTAGGDFIFGPEFMTEPLRIFTPSTEVEFSQVQKEYVTNLRKKIKASQLEPEEKTRKLQQLESIILFGRLLFSQSASLHFLQNMLNKEHLSNQVIENNLQHLRELVHQEGIKFESSRFETLSRRKAFKQAWRETMQSINDSSLSQLEKKTLINDVSKSRDFYYQCNDLNFTYANKPSRSFSNFVNSYQGIGSKVSLAASIIAIGASALAFIPVLAPIMGPIALAASTIALVIGLPLALKGVGTMLYNLIRFGVEPTPDELINTVLLATSILLSGIGNVVGQAVSAGGLTQTASLVTQGVISANNLTKVSLGVVRQIGDFNNQSVVNHYKSELGKLKMQPERSQSSDDDSYLTSGGSL